ncbi:N-acetylglucosamine-6-phosphate deacetylase, partial [Caligus rogercresseyi]
MSKVYRFTNCFLLRDHSIVKEDLWIRDGLIQDPQNLFYEERISEDESFDLNGALISPGLIDLQINGALGYDFSTDITDDESAALILSRVTTYLLSRGVTSFCPTLVTSPQTTYEAVLPRVCPKGPILGLHLEGPFISQAKKGAHPRSTSRGPGMKGIIGRLGREAGVRVALGHSVCDVETAEAAVEAGAVMVTHLFNAMSAFHHRSDPGLLGLLTTIILLPREKTKKDQECSSASYPMGPLQHGRIRLAYKTNFRGLCLVTDALGQLDILVKGKVAIVKGTKDTLCGPRPALGGQVEALEAASLHPAEALGIQEKKGTLNYGSDADFIVLNRNPMGGPYELLSTWTAGVKVYDKALSS